MPSLTQLPAEMRQQILLLVLPDTHRVESAVPIQFIQLFHINQRLRLDMVAVAGIWTPIHYISSPCTLTARSPRTRGWNLNRICLDLFSTSFLGRIVNRYPNAHHPNYLHPELIALWNNAVPFLPKDVEEVWLGVTPAPAEKRVHHPTWQECGPRWIDVFVHNDHASQRFLGGHIQDVAALVKKIDDHYEGCVSIKLSGRLSVKSAFFVEAIGQEVEKDLEFVGRWVSNEEAPGAAVSSQLLCPMARKKRRCGTHLLAWLGNVAWSKEAGDAYAGLADQGFDRMLMEDIKGIAKLCDGEGMIVLLPGNILRRAFQHRVAADLGLKTVEVSEGSDRHVVVRR
ncbi:uncharacterized protein EKO05_0008760 [Ascochyta rabiei]|uniref:Uncharacterized protein n=1 Tax=Didymella rabiei TaxID=5454 RepID=A0A163JY36_DIDRA|nr:uncharacterized protein EKO05_0008760 [Ascochyta rabiei]KZM26660.1 hypothetical protein ST47_g2194 [Ascochyta rabiei]UPX18461.1 hypothetical protein EKO05_0008760 [Ascochyta rabiei]